MILKDIIKYSSLICVFIFVSVLIWNTVYIEISSHFAFSNKSKKWRKIMEGTILSISEKNVQEVTGELHAKI